MLKNVPEGFFHTAHYANDRDDQHDQSRHAEARHRRLFHEREQAFQRASQRRHTRRWSSVDRAEILIKERLDRLLPKPCVEPERLAQRKRQRERWDDGEHGVKRERCGAQMQAIAKEAARSKPHESQHQKRRPLRCA